MATKPIDWAESVAGEEDPGASADIAMEPGDVPVASQAPVQPGDETACPSCGGTGQLGGSTCPECEGTGRIAA